MDRDQAQRNVRETLEGPFEKGRFTLFVKNLLNSIEDAPFSYKGNLLPDAYDQYISTLERIGKYSNGEHKIDILVVKLKKETSIDRARTMQRNFIAWYLNGSRGGEQKDAALVAFVSPDQEDWRFSLVRMDYRFEEGKNGKIKAKEEFTLARRWSFLVGANETSHTAQSRLVPIMADDEYNPTLSRLEAAFNIETVTKEFFEKYRELFLWTKEILDSIISENKMVETDFAAKGVNTIDFAKKLLGQIVFLYFLQKKGWFGVGRDADWGTGPKSFLRELFAGKHGTYANFFNDILEPLFYEALARERDGDFYSRFNCKIPFLNGGLFDPIGGYDWVHTDIFLPDELFSNSHKTKEGDTGKGILDIFDRYNFTVKEDEPLEKEVAVDPEMLGKVFENLLEVKDRKSKGTYYTPREIVHYMCRQSLINYLETQLNGPVVAYEMMGNEQLDMFGNDAKTGQLDLTIEHRSAPAIPKEDIEKLIQTGEQFGENDAIALEKEQRIIEGRQKTSTKKTMLPDSIREQAKLIDDKLAAIKVCDPAIGSGAFPVGMMGEIVKTRNVLSIFIKEPNRTSYHFKRECIEKSLYGVDIDPGAVEIAKLRLWLSLVVDEDDIREIKPLPNLDYKIVCGNSLGSASWDVWDNKLFKELESLKMRYFDETSPGRKKEEKARIDELIQRITHNEQQFDYKIFFSEVFDHGNGFDVVIANPPYVRQEAIKALKPMLAKEFREFYCGTADLYTYFYKRGLQNLRTGGHLCFIAPNKFMRAGYGKNTRELLAQKATLKAVIDFCDLPIFDATTYPSILLVENRLPVKEQTTLAATFTDAAQLERIEETLDAVGFPMPLTALRKEGWTLEPPQVLALMEKLRKAGTPLGEYVKGRFYYGIKTALNEAFVIDEVTKECLIAEDPKSAELIKPWLRGRDIKRWKAQWAGLYLITIPSSANRKWPWSNSKTEQTARTIFEKTYPAIHCHLSQWEDKLKKRDDQGQYWWELRSCAYYEEFDGPKIIYPNITKKNVFAFDTTGWFTNQKCFIIPTSDLCLLSVLNSKVGLQWFTKALPLLRGGFFEPSAIFMKDFPVPSATDTQRAPIITLVERILADRDSPDIRRLEAEINRLVYDLYNLTPDEIAIVEGGK
ncbi:MAG: restriction endonuclease [Syntrophus sp. (in: bacteria)]|nr:restriction endonuclease [Syntrophus sp. (in: bacteria)]